MGSTHKKSSFHPEILTKTQKKVLTEVGPLLSDWGFYLAGGTALALHLGHRKSKDFDWFAQTPKRAIESLAGHLREAEVNFIQDSSADVTLYGRVAGVKISMIRFPYPLLRRTVAFADCACQLAALPDIAAMKLSAISQRGVKRDFVDIFALLQQSITLSDMLGYYRKKFNTEETAHVVFSLTYFVDAEKDPMPPMFWRVRWPDIKKRMLQEVSKISPRWRGYDR